MARQIHLICSVPYFFLLVCCPYLVSSLTRKLKNETLCQELGLIQLTHIIADGESDSIHYLYSSHGSFTIYTALTPLNTNITVNCSTIFTRENGKSVSFNKKPSYSFIVLFTNLYEFYDSSDKADITKVPDSNITKISFSDFTWNDPAFISSNEKIDIAFSIANSTINSTFYSYNSLKLILSVSGSTSRSSVLPRLLHTPNSTEINFILDKMNVTSEKPRFAVEMLLLGETPDSYFNLTSSSSLDDEFTPGVFKLVQVWSGYCQKSEPGAYAQWKPIVYTSEQHSRESATSTLENGTVIENLKPVPDNIRNSIAFAMYNGSFNKTFAQRMNVTFGLTNDGFYIATNYSSWTLAVGYGIPPEDIISTLVIIVIAVGLGIPFLLLIAGGIYIFVKRYRRRNDDLLLSD